MDLVIDYKSSKKLKVGGKNINIMRIQAAINEQNFIDSFGKHKEIFGLLLQN